MTVLGKRKKAGAPAEAATTKPTKVTKSAKATATDTDAIQDVFRRHFEAQFKPLAVVKDKKTKKKSKKTKSADDDDDDDDNDDNDDDEVPQKGKAVVIRENESDDEEDDEEEGDEDDSNDSDDDDDWSGLSDNDNDNSQTPAVQVVDYSAPAPRDDPTLHMTKHERKLYLSAKVPSSLDAVAPKPAKTTAADDASHPQYKDAPELLANDLALQRLISESHLLAGAFALPSSFSTSAGAAATFGAAGSSTAKSKHTQPFAAGRLRQRTTDLRIQAVASKARGGGDAAAGGTITVHNAKESIYNQEKMPMGMRKGIAAAAAAREQKRRREARESGIVLERPQAAAAAVSAKKQKQKRLRAVDAPAVGVMRGSELKLRDKDIRAIEGPKKTVRGGKGGGKRR